ncbi:hypothetical protein T11_724, partial [Trichinella zimbabwensis]
LVSIDRKQFAKYNERNLTAPSCLFPEIFVKNRAASNVLTQAIPTLEAIYSTTTGLFQVKLSKIQ